MKDMHHSRTFLPCSTPLSFLSVLLVCLHLQTFAGQSWTDTWGWESYSWDSTYDYWQTTSSPSDGVTHGSAGGKQNHSCADWMENTWSNPLEDGYYEITYNGTYYSYLGGTLVVYCQFNYTSSYAWTLVESFEYNYYSYFRYYAFYENYPYNEGYVENYKDSVWRMSYYWMLSLYDSMHKLNATGDGYLNRKMLSTCNFDTSFERDYVLFNLDDSDMVYSPLTSYWSYTCMPVEEVDVRGYSCKDSDVYMYNYGYHLYLGSYSTSCSCHPWYNTAVYNEENFGYYSYSSSSFSCSEDYSSTTNWWLGRKVDQTGVSQFGDVSIEDYNFVLFQNLTCRDTSIAYAHSSDITLKTCLRQCLYDYIFNGTCRYTIFLQAQKTDSDTKCLLFSEWCQFGSSYTYSNDEELVYALDFSLISYDDPADWYDKYFDDCPKYYSAHWCTGTASVAGDDAYQTTQVWNEFFTLRDRSKYNLTAIDTCGACGGGISEFNGTNVSVSVVQPLFGSFEELIFHNHELKCYLNFETILLDSNRTSSLADFDRVVLYSMCLQYQRKLSAYYTNKNQTSHARLVEQFDCDVFSLEQSSEIDQVDFKVCRYNITDNSMATNLNSTDFVFALGVKSNSGGRKYNVYLSNLWVDLNNVEYLKNGYDTITSVHYKTCESEIYSTETNQYSMAWLPCNMKNDFEDSDLVTEDHVNPITTLEPEPQNRAIYSCADWMHTSNTTLVNGYYVVDHYVEKANLSVYCQFDYNRSYAWTLIESFSRSQYYQFQYYTFNESYAYMQDQPWYRFSVYRLGSSWMRSVFNSMPEYRKESPSQVYLTQRKLLSTCNFATDFSKDWMLFNLDSQDPSMYNPLFDTWYGYACIPVESANIRGYGECKNSDIYLYNSGYHPYTNSFYSSYCSCNSWQDTAHRDERNFGEYTSYNRFFSCTESDDSTTNWWLGQVVPDAANSDNPGAAINIPVTTQIVTDDGIISKGDGGHGSHGDSPIVAISVVCGVVGFILGAALICFVIKRVQARKFKVQLDAMQMDDAQDHAVAEVDDQQAPAAYSAVPAAPSEVSAQAGARGGARGGAGDVAPSEGAVTGGADAPMISALDYEAQRN